MRRTQNIGTACAAALLVLAILPLAAYDPPQGGFLMPLFGAPHALGSGLSVTAQDAPWADRLNPAASATQQRPVIDAGYTLISDFGSQGVGTGLALGLSLPVPYGVWGAGLRYAGLPSTMTDLPLGSYFEARASLAKDLFPNLHVGAGLNLALGSGGGFGWGLGLDLGMIHKLGDLGFLKDFRYGLVLANVGKGYVTPQPGGSSSYPAAFTLSGGARALLVRTEELKLGLGLDLAFPSFQDLGFDLSASLAIGRYFTVKTSWGFPSVRELAAGNSKSLLPAIGLSALIPIERQSDDSFISRQGWDRSEIRPALAAAPLYGNLWAIGAGVSLPLGVIDRAAPIIEAKFPGSTWGPEAYLSPNSDGTKDLLEVPVRLTDRRYIMAYALRIRRAGSPEPVRIIANKESRPETQGLSGVWARLLYMKQGVPLPSTLSWNGVADSGEIVPDGQYELFFEAIDDNGNRAELGPFVVVIDNTPPAVEIRSPVESLIFSPDGDGNKDAIRFGLSGSVEDLWTLSVRDASGKPVRILEFKNAAPADFVWDGRNDDGAVVPDGVYSLLLAATDRAGNQTQRRVGNILVNTQQPPINLAIDLGAFSPNGDGVRDSLRLSPSVPVRTGLASYTLSVIDKDRREVWSLSGTDPAALKEAYAFDGRGADLAALPEGSYQGRLAVTYVNGHSPVVLSPAFVIDLSPPRAQARADREAFNPAGEAEQSRVTFEQSGSAEERWTGELIGPDGKPARTWNFGSKLDPRLEWDGTDDAGAPVPDGVYTYRLKSTDRAGNSFSSAPSSVAVDTEKKDARVSADLRAFSPNADGQKDILRLAVEVKAPESLRNYELAILPAGSEAAPVRTWTGERGLSPSFVWDGRRDDGGAAGEGRYLARLTVRYQNDDRALAQSLPFLLDLTPPALKVSGEPLVFSPNGDGRLDSIAFSQTSLPGDDWEGHILDASGTPVKNFAWKGQAEGFTWDGTDEAGNRVPEGNYRYEASSVDEAGNRGQAAFSGIKVDARLPQVFVTAAAPGLSPNGDGFLDDVAFSLIVNLREGISSWRFSLLDEAGAERASFGGESGDIPPRIVWDGKSSTGAVVEGRYIGYFRVDYAKGDRAEARTGAVVVDVRPPEVSLKISPEFFSPDNDGVNDELSFDLSVRDESEIAAWRLEIDEASVEESPGQRPRERLFINWNGTGSPARRIVWEGRSARGELVEAATDYPFFFEIGDIYGNRSRVSGAIAVDVLVIREDERLKIKVPSIVFRPNFADFQDLSPETLERNKRVVARIAEILNKFKDYRIAIEGHANSIAKIMGLPEAKVAEEETRELLPLSTARAELVRRLLVENGVDARRLTVLGRGSSAPVVDFKDAVNRWKNRRVEFILIKNP